MFARAKEVFVGDVGRKAITLYVLPEVLLHVLLGVSHGGWVSSICFDPVLQLNAAYSTKMLFVVSHHY